MIPDQQKTIAKETSVSGIGLHTAHKAKVTFKPAPVDSGIVFIRTDVAGAPQIKAGSESLLLQGRSPRRTSVGGGDVQIHTIEHLLAALSGLGIDNLIVELDNKEIPGLDGSARGFMEAVRGAGIVEQGKERRYFSVKEPIIIEEEGSTLIMVPDADFRISYTLDYDHEYLKTQFFSARIDADTFCNQLCGARTFCLESEAQALRDRGVGCGANYENTLVVGKDGVVKNTLRYDDEFVRHKVLDLMGDLYAFGQPLKGHVIALKSGHALNVKLLKKLEQQRQLLAGTGAPVYQGPLGETLDINMIMKIIPHREPFLFVDRIVHIEKGRRATGIKNVTINDYFFKGHFPGRPVMPGVLIVEAMAQVGGVMMLAAEENRGKLAFFLAINGIKFRKTVVPGDQLVLEVEAGKIKSKTGQVFGKALVDGKVVCEAEMMFALIE